jgi:hypothetical protein
MKTKHTQGKWHVEEDNLIVDENGYGIAQQYGIRNSKNWDYDANLIAAAPDLLESLESLLKITNSYMHPQIDYIRGKSQQAINKAKGE